MIALVIALMSPFAHAAPGLKLRPGSFGVGTEGAWKSKQGLADSKGNARHALYLQKFTDTATISAGFAVIDNIEGTAVSELTGLSWDHRVDGHCGAGAPRWNIQLERPDGSQYTVISLGCAAAMHSGTGGPDWERDSYSGPTIQLAVTSAGGNPATDKIVQLYILFDEGTDVTPGFVYLDNITVNGKVFTGPMDNGNH
jgi:hypothetical protein